MGPTEGRVEKAVLGTLWAIQRLVGPPKWLVGPPEWLAGPLEWFVAPLGWFVAPVGSTTEPVGACGEKCDCARPPTLKSQINARLTGSSAVTSEIWDTFSQTIREGWMAPMSGVWKRGENFTVSFTTRPNAASSAAAATE